MNKNAKERKEKVPANPIPEAKYNRFKFKLEEESVKYAERNLTLFLLGVATGYRLQDIVDLTIGEIIEALVEGKFVIQEKKQYRAWLKKIEINPGSKRKLPKKREVIIESNLRRILKDYCRGKSKSAYAFESNKKGRYISAKAFSDILSKIGSKLEIKNISGHSLRKTYATRLWRSIRDLEFVRKALGHTSIEITKVYLGLDEEVRKSAASIVDEKL